MSLQHTNFQFIAYINYYDLVNKFAYKNFYFIPKPCRLSLAIFLKGRFTLKLFQLCLTSFLLLYFFCYSLPLVRFVAAKLPNRKKREYKTKVLITYVFMKKKLLLSIFNLFFLFTKFIRPFFFSCQRITFSKTNGKAIYSPKKLIIFLPQNLIVDSADHRCLRFFEKFKVFLSVTVKSVITFCMFNFFAKTVVVTKKNLKNFLLIWRLY